jgi:hypothetical protein
VAASVFIRLYAFLVGNQNGPCFLIAPFCAKPDWIVDKHNGLLCTKLLGLPMLVTGQKSPDETKVPMVNVLPIAGIDAVSLRYTNSTNSEG